MSSVVGASEGVDWLSFSVEGCTDSVVDGWLASVDAVSSLDETVEDGASVSLDAVDEDSSGAAVETGACVSESVTGAILASLPCVAASVEGAGSEEDSKPTVVGSSLATDDASVWALSEAGVDAASSGGATGASSGLLDSGVVEGLAFWSADASAGACSGTFVEDWGKAAIATDSDGLLASDGTAEIWGADFGSTLASLTIEADSSLSGLLSARPDFSAECDEDEAIPGTLGMWSPIGWKPFSSAM